ncbi:MAG TPA: FapA family protein [Clostridia bacterium]|nr:FapA family protein [Clostridia bacterium]
MKQEDQEKKGSLLFRLLQAKQKNEPLDLDALSHIDMAPAISAPEEAASINGPLDEARLPIPVESTPNEPQVEADSWVSLMVPPLSWDDHRRLEIQVNKATTKARLFLRPPAEGEHETCTLEILNRVLKDCRITFGVDEEALNSFFKSYPNLLLYNTPVVVAQGTPAIEGIDGYVRELFDRTSRPHFDERPDGSIDFKNMHIVNNVSKGTVICEIINPVQGTVGTSVYNKPLRPYTAKAPAIPRGENVDLVTVDEHMSQLIAATDGNLVYKDKRFCVEHTFRVNGNVNNSVGNINFTGNVVVTGDVCEGYSIRTNGDVTVYGIVEGASIYAGGSIILQKGINGMGKGILEAQKDITAKFIENCTVRAGGDIKSESIINSTVESDGGIMLAGRGTLVGGSITAFGSVEAKIVGSRSNTPINIALGVTPNMLRERNQVRQQHKAVLSEFQSLNSDILFLDQAQHLSEAERQKLLEQYKGKLNLVLFKKNRLEKKIQKFSDQQAEALSCTLTCNTAFPPLRITIGNETYRLTNIANMCRFYQNSDGEVVLGTK